MSTRYRYFVVRNVGMPSHSVEEFKRKRDAIDVAAYWVQSPLRTQPRTAQV